LPSGSRICISRSTFWAHIDLLKFDQKLGLLTGKINIPFAEQ
jgi:hypothetical protein